MTTPSIAQGNGSQNGQPATPASAESLTHTVDQLHSLRYQIKALIEQERALTSSVIAALQHEGGRFAHGTCATAILDYRHTPVIDPTLLYLAVGDKAFGAFRVIVEDARKLLGGDALAEITTETRTTPVLRVEARQ